MKIRRNWPYAKITRHWHINVEVVSSVWVGKYLYKYIYRVHDSSVIEIGGINQDEIKDFVETRSVGPVLQKKESLYLSFTCTFTQ